MMEILGVKDISEHRKLNLRWFLLCWFKLLLLLTG